MLQLKTAPRGLRHFENPGPQVISGVILMLGLTAYLFWQEIWLFRSWSVFFHGLANWFGIDAGVSLSRDGALSVVTQLPGSLPGHTWSSLSAVGVATSLWLGTYLMDVNKVPLRYGVRALALILGLPALGHFAFQIDADMNVEAHVAEVFKMGFWFIALLPALYALTAFVLPGNFVKKAALTLMAMGYFFVSVPVLALVHFVVLTNLGQSWAPFLNVVLTVFLMSFHVICFYGLLASTED